MKGAKKSGCWNIYYTEKDRIMLEELKERYNIEATTQLFRLLLKKDFKSKK